MGTLPSVPGDDGTESITAQVASTDHHGAEVRTVTWKGLYSFFSWVASFFPIYPDLSVAQVLPPKPTSNKRVSWRAIHCYRWHDPQQTDCTCLEAPNQIRESSGAAQAGVPALQLAAGSSRIWADFDDQRSDNVTNCFGIDTSVQLMIVMKFYCS